MQLFSIKAGKGSRVHDLRRDVSIRFLICASDMYLNSSNSSNSMLHMPSSRCGFITAVQSANRSFLISSIFL